MTGQRGIHRLRAKELDGLPVGWHDDGGGLRFRVIGASRNWVQG
jgi:hypothetical protein